MLASELIKTLTYIVETHGDIPLTLLEEGNEYELLRVEVCTQIYPHGLFEVGSKHIHLS
jgi:hypothetical protein